MKQDSLDSPVHDSLLFVFIGTNPLGFSQKAASLPLNWKTTIIFLEILKVSTLSCVDSPSDLLIL